MIRRRYETANFCANHNAAPSLTARAPAPMVRRALFQVHLWAGIGVGLYVLVIGVSGSVLMFREELAGPNAEEK